MAIYNFAADFGSNIVYMYNAGTSVVPEGCGVRRHLTMTTAPDPANENSPASNIFGVVLCDTTAAGSGDQNLLGISVASIAATAWGPVCIGGKCKALLTASVSIAAGEPITQLGTLGRFIKAATPFALVAAVSMTADATYTTAKLIDCFVEPIRVFGGGGAAYH